MKRIGTCESGQSIAEVLIALAIFTLLIVAVGAMTMNARAMAYGALSRTQAQFLAVEGFEAARSIRDGNFENLAAGVHGIVLSGGHWEFSGTSDSDGKYERTIEVSDIDASTKHIRSTVRWAAGGARGEEIEIVGHLTARE